MTSPRATATALVVLFWPFISAPAHAATIYRWVDEGGKIHLADTVPEEYRARATTIDSRQFDVAPDEAAQARARADQMKAQAAADAPARTLPSTAAARPTGAPRTALTQSDFEKLDCATQWKLYRESLECFAPYIQREPWTAPPEAFQACTVLKDPSARCPINYAPGMLNNPPQ